MSCSDGELAGQLTRCLCDAFTTEPRRRPTTILHCADVILAEGPDPAVADKLQLFGQFVGSWDVAVTNHRPDGSSETILAEWHFAWALGGRAFQDA